MARLREITVLVVGSAGPLDAAISSRLIAEGATVIAAQPADAPSVATAVPDAQPDPVDRRSLKASDDDDWLRLATAIRTDYGALHGLVHAPGPIRTAPLADMAADDVRATIDGNLLGPALGIRTIAPLLASSGGGSIVTIASSEALRGTGNAAVLSAANWGLRGLTRSAALELGPAGIRVNTVCPPIGLLAEVDTVAHPALADRNGQRAVTMGDVAAMVAFLLSDDSATCTGGDFLVDAGATA